MSLSVVTKEKNEAFWLQRYFAQLLKVKQKQNRQSKLTKLAYIEIFLNL